MARTDKQKSAKRRKSTRKTVAVRVRHTRHQALKTGLALMVLAASLAAIVASRPAGMSQVLAVGQSESQKEPSSPAVIVEEPDRERDTSYVDLPETEEEPDTALDYEQEGAWADMEEPTETDEPVDDALDESDEASGERYLDVDLSAQYAMLVDTDGSVLWESPIVSGDEGEGFGTPAGTYNIYALESGAELVGRDYDGDGEPDYDNYVDFWMPFYGGYGLHDASWRYDFGGEVYAYDGSHGCVNLPYDNASELFDLVTVGETVVVHW